MNNIEISSKRLELSSKKLIPFQRILLEYYACEDIKLRVYQTKIYRRDLAEKKRGPSPLEGIGYGAIYMDDYPFIGKFSKLKKVASAMANLTGWRIAFFPPIDLNNINKKES